MRMTLFAAAVLCAIATAAEIIPVETWPKTIATKDAITYNATENDCIKAGYRLIPAKPETPTGWQIQSQQLVQDDKTARMATWAIVYEAEIVAKPPVFVPEVLTNVPAASVVFTFTTNGEFRGVIWTASQALTNKVTK